MIETGSISGRRVVGDQIEQELRWLAGHQGRVLAYVVEAALAVGQDEDLEADQWAPIKHGRWTSGLMVNTLQG